MKSAPRKTGTVVTSGTYPTAHSVQFVKGIGPFRASALEKYGVRTLRDLFLYVPRRYLDRSSLVTIAELRSSLMGSAQDQLHGLEVKRDSTVVGEVRSFRVVGFGRKARFVLVLADDTASMQCVWFGGVQYWKNAFEVGEVLAVSGQPGFYGNILQFVHPDFDRLSRRKAGDREEGEEDLVDWTKKLHTGGLVPIYPSGKDLERVGLDGRGFRRVMSTAINTYADRIPETLPATLLASRHLMNLRAAIRSVHFPQSYGELSDGLGRLKYEELFYFQVMLALRRRSIRDDADGIGFSVQSKLARQLVDSLPFTLTKAQIRVIREITADMQSARSMHRLLQGDVGSGKTIVALLCMLIAVENGYQAAFMAPTEILAEQHFKTLVALLNDIPVNIRLLVGGQRSRIRRDVLDDIRRGSARIVVGTHALFEKGVEFDRLGFVVIDEQHRFGVMQRASIRRKGVNPDVLVMTATPIPRTLSLTIYGDLDVSIIDELPADRKPIKTLLKYEEEKKAVFEFVRSQVRQGRQAYCVYPLIEESEKLDLKAATVHYDRLRKEVFPDLRMGLIHGRLSSEEKDAIMRQFKSREIDILVATTVIEVGIDVPNASVMVVENAERFGLSQLHQLRGRVGRGGDQSYCILLTRKWIGGRAKRLMADPAAGRQAFEQQKQAERRLATMVETNDGFRIAEVDLEIRGPGDFFGTRQSGVPEFKVANIVADAKILEVARSDAFKLVADDPHLTSPDHQPVANHLREHFREELALLHAG